MSANTWNGEEIIEAARKNCHNVFNPDDREDAEQEFALGALLAQSKLDGREIGATTFVWAHARGRVQHFIRDELQRPEISFALVENEQGESLPGESLVPSKDKEQSEQLAEQEISSKVQDAINNLSPDQKAVISGLFFQGKTLEDIGQELSVSKQYVFTLRNKALESLHYSLSSLEFC